VALTIKRIPVGIALACTMLAVALSGLAFGTARASAVSFCSGVTLAPYGQGGDRCWGPSRQGLNYSAVRTYQRAGCVDIANSSNVLLASWICGAAGSAPGLAAAIGYNQDLLGYHKGVIRNNNLSASGTFGGEFACANGCTS